MNEIQIFFHTDSGSIELTLDSSSFVLHSIVSAVGNIAQAELTNDSREIYHRKLQSYHALTIALDELKMDISRDLVKLTH